MSDHKLSIKVLRLGRPNLQHSQHFDGPSTFETNLSLPKTIGPCFAGERFRCLIGILATEAIDDAHMIVEIQSPGLEPYLVSEQKGMNFKPDTPFTLKIDELLDAPGPRVLGVIIRYKDAEHLRTLSKTFSFEVTTAVRTRIRVHPVGPELKVTFTEAVEVQVENNTETTLTLRGCDFRSETSSFLNVPTVPVILKPHDIYSYGAYASSGTETKFGEAVINWVREPLGFKGLLKIPLRK